MLNDKDLEQIKSHGLELSDVERQLENFRKGFDFLPVSAAAVRGNGITVIAPEEASRLAESYTRQARELKIVKFVPASGAATRMFKELFEFVASGKTTPAIETLTGNIARFAFYDRLHAATGDNPSRHDLVDAIINRGLGYGTQPKALITFHKYAGETRTAMEEHMVEAALYGAGAGVAAIHFTVSPEHRAGFEAQLAASKDKFEKRYGVRYKIGFSQQKPSTDTIAVTPENEPFRESDGRLLFRPAGHGALIENLGDIDAGVIFIKTVDNVTTDSRRDDTVLWKKALAGYALALQEKTFAWLDALDKGGAPLDEIAAFIENELSYKLPPGAGSEELRQVLDRPLRVCGMVRNEGEPGGGPFWVKNTDGSLALQIAESSQIAPQDMDLMREATHFNPVDLVCLPKGRGGKAFDLARYVDPGTGFISEKSKDGRALKAQELPGLWNGAMARWNTVFVEVPITTFSPVKVVNDLLREQHQ